MNKKTHKHTKIHTNIHNHTNRNKHVEDPQNITETSPNKDIKLKKQQPY